MNLKQISRTKVHRSVVSVRIFSSQCHEASFAKTEIDSAVGDFSDRLLASPDLDRETFPYRFVGVKGRIEGKILFADEIDIESDLFNLSGQGKIDLERKTLDGKGLIAVIKPITKCSFGSL